MREYGFLFGAEHLSLGLRPDSRVNNSSYYMKKLINLRPTRYGLIAQEPLTCPISTPTSTVSTWPFPQLLTSDETVIEAFDRATNPGSVLYTVNTSTWGTTALSIYDAGTPANAWTFSTAAKPWHFEAFDTIWFLSNGVDLVFNHPQNASDKILATTTVQIGALGADRTSERLLMGGMSGSYFTAGSNLWSDSLLPVWQQVTPGLTHEDQTFGPNWLFYSRPLGGATDVPYGEAIYFLDLMTAVNEAAVGPLYLEALERGEWGFIVMPTPGSILHIKDMGSSIIVYTSDSIYALAKTQTGYGKPQRLAEFGLLGRGCVTGPTNFHAFINANGSFCTIQEGGLQNHKFDEFLSALTPTTTVMAFDSEEFEFYASDGVKGYIWTGTGLGETTKAPTSLTRRYGPLYGTFKTISAATAFSLQTCPFDFGARDVNTIKAIQVSSEGLTGLKGQLKYNYRNGATYAVTPLKNANHNGVIYTKSTAPENEVLLEGTIDDAGTARITYIHGRYQTPGRQATRGTRGGLSTGRGDQTSASEQASDS